MSKKQYPALYVTSTKGTFFKHCSINKTIYFEIVPDSARYETDANYAQYMDEMQTEALQAIIHKFIGSQPLLVTNDKKPFLIFKSNIDIQNVEYFCKAILDELYYSVDIDHKAKYRELETIFVQIDKQPALFKGDSIGQKLTQMDDFEQKYTLLEGSHEKVDSGILTPYKEFLLLKKEQEEQEKIVTW